MITDFLADMLSRIRNGYRARLSAIKLSSSTPEYCVEILKILEREGYIFYFETYFDNVLNKKMIKVFLKYDGLGSSVISNIYKVSKNGCRVYISIQSLWKSKSNGGIYILATSKGFLTDQEARIFNVGGEVLLGLY